MAGEDTNDLLSQDNTDDAGEQGSTDQNKEQGAQQENEQGAQKDLLDNSQQSDDKGDNQDGSDVKGAPETYADFSIPEGYTLDKGTLETFVPVLKKHKLSQEAAQEFVDLHVAQLKSNFEQQEKWLNDLETQWIDQAKNHKELGGSKFEASSEVAKSVLTRFFNKEAVGIMKASRLVNNPDLWAGFVAAGNHIQTLTNKIKELTGEDEFIPGDKKTEQKSAQDKRYPTMD